MDDYQRYTLSYRTSEALQVMNWIKAGQCGSIVGLRGSGKSNFIRFLLRVDIQQHYLQENPAGFTFVLINLLSLSERSEWAVYEMIVNNLLAQLHSVNVENEILLQVDLLHQEIMRVRDVLTAERAVERCVKLFCQHHQHTLVLLFDEFDVVFRDLPASLFRCLRDIRDSCKDQVSYIVVGTHDLASLRTDLAEEVDHFYRLVSRNACWLGAYSDADARQMAGYLAFKYSLQLSQGYMTRLLELSGAHAGLIKSILSLLWNGGDVDVLPSSTTLIEESVIQRECQKIWSSLSEREKSALCSLSSGNPLNEPTSNHLFKRGLVRRSGKSARVIFSPLFAAFVQRQLPPPQTGTYIHRDLHMVQLAGQRFENLTELEFELLCHLYEHRSQVCTKNDLIDHVYRQQYDAAASDEMLQALILRLRKKIEPEFQHPRYIVTVRGQGYKFVLSDQPDH